MPLPLVRKNLQKKRTPSELDHSDSDLARLTIPAQFRDHIKNGETVLLKEPRYGDTPDIALSQGASATGLAVASLKPQNFEASPVCVGTPTCAKREAITPRSNTHPLNFEEPFTVDDNLQGSRKIGSDPETAHCGGVRGQPQKTRNDVPPTALASPIGAGELDSEDVNSCCSSSLEGTLESESVASYNDSLDSCYPSHTSTNSSRESTTDDGPDPEELQAELHSLLEYSLHDEEEYLDRLKLIGHRGTGVLTEQQELRSSCAGRTEACSLPFEEHSATGNIDTVATAVPFRADSVGKKEKEEDEEYKDEDSTPARLRPTASDFCESYRKNKRASTRECFPEEGLLGPEPLVTYCEDADIRARRGADVCSPLLPSSRFRLRNSDLLENPRKTRRASSRAVSSSSSSVALTTADLVEEPFSGMPSSTSGPTVGGGRPLTTATLALDKGEIKRPDPPRGLLGDMTDTASLDVERLPGSVSFGNDHRVGSVFGDDHTESPFPTPYLSSNSVTMETSPEQESSRMGLPTRMHVSNNTLVRGRRPRRARLPGQKQGCTSQDADLADGEHEEGDDNDDEDDDDDDKDGLPSRSSTSTISRSVSPSRQDILAAPTGGDSAFLSKSSNITATTPSEAAEVGGTSPLDMESTAIMGAGPHVAAAVKASYSQGEDCKGGGVATTGTIFEEQESDLTEYYWRMATEHRAASCITTANAIGNHVPNTSQPMLVVGKPSTDTLDFSHCRNLPPPRENEIEFVFENYLTVREDVLGPERFWSQPKTYNGVVFRVLVFPKGNKTYRPGNLSAYVAVDPSAAFPERFKTMWFMHRCDYMLTVINWKNWKDLSVVKNEQFSFSSEDIDRGWVDLVPAHSLKPGEFLSPSGDLVIRAQICPRAVDVSAQHLFSRRDVGYIGIRNQGATCYLNALVQALYHIGAFRKSVFQLTIESDKAFVKDIGKNGGFSKHRGFRRRLPLREDTSSSSTDYSMSDEGEPSEHLSWTEEEIRQAFEEEPDLETSLLPGGGRVGDAKVSQALQSLFLELSESDEVANTEELIRSFGWESNDSLTQHDAQELNRLLCDRLEEQMKGTPAEGVIERLFMGEFENYVECIDVPYGSSRRETFYDLQLDVQNAKDIYESLQHYTAEEVLEGDNLYDAEQFGRQRARKGVRFIRFPPVIQFHLKRFTFDPMRMDMVKINQRFEYPRTLDLSGFCQNAGTYELFCIIVHAGDVGGGHYYVMNRPGGREWWMKFDDEKVYPVSVHSAFGDAYGGHDPVCFDYFTHFNDPHYKPESPSVKLHSAYILFYVESSKCQEVLTEPIPRQVNRYLFHRRRWEEDRRLERQRIRNYVQSYIQVRYVTESCLRGFKGTLTDLHTLPACGESRSSRDMKVLNLWKTINNLIEKSEVLDNPFLREAHKTHHHGLWYFDAAVTKTSTRLGDVRPLACHLSESSGANREFTLGDHFGWIARCQRKPWAPTLPILVHPLTRYHKTDIRSVPALQNAISYTKLFIAKFFYPGSDEAAATASGLCDAFTVVAGIGTLRVERDKRQPFLCSLFVQLLRNLANVPPPVFEDGPVEAFVQKAIKMYVGSKASLEDPLNIEESVYLEYGGAFEHLTGDMMTITDKLESPRHFRVDEPFPPVIVFAISPPLQRLTLRAAAERYGVTSETVDIYEEDTNITRALEEHIPGRSMATDVPKHTSDACAVYSVQDATIDDPQHEVLVHVADQRSTEGPEAADLKKAADGGTTPGSRPPRITTARGEDNASTGPGAVVVCTGKEDVSASSLSADVALAHVRQKERETLSTTEALSGDSTPYIRSRLHPPRMPSFVICNPDHWHTTLTRSKILVTLKLYDPLAVLSRWEDASGHPVSPDASDEKTTLRMSGSIGDLTKIPPSNASARLSGDSAELIPIGGAVGETGCAPSPSVVQGSSHTKRVVRCPPLREVKAEIDLRWPYRLALRRLTWILGVDADSCMVQPVSPLSTDAPAFTTRLPPTLAERLIFPSQWNAPRFPPPPPSAAVANDTTTAYATGGGSAPTGATASPAGTRPPYTSMNPSLQAPTAPTSGGAGHAARTPNMSGALASEPASRLDELHSVITQRQGAWRYRDLTCAFDQSFDSGAEYHFSLLPRPSTDPILGVLTHPSPVTPNRLILIRVFNTRVESVGAVFVTVDLTRLPTVAQLVQEAQQRITSIMEQRGASRHGRYRLVWEGLPYPDHSGVQQIVPVVSRLDLMTDALLHTRLPMLCKSFQFNSCLRIEPEFTENQLRDLDVSVSLPPLLSLSDQFSSPRALRVTVFHQNRERQYFGHPFFIIVSSCDTLKAIKEKIQRKLGLSDTHFSKWKFFVYDYDHTSFVKDDEVPDFSRDRPACLLAVHRNIYASEDKARSLQLHIK